VPGEPVAHFIAEPRGERQAEAPQDRRVLRVTEDPVGIREQTGDDEVIGEVGGLVRAAVGRVGTEPALAADLEALMFIPVERVDRDDPQPCDRNECRNEQPVTLQELPPR
jgi:hypothetical protein